MPRYPNWVPRYRIECLDTELGLLVFFDTGLGQGGQAGWRCAEKLTAPRCSQIAMAGSAAVADDRGFEARLDIGIQELGVSRTGLKYGGLENRLLASTSQTSFPDNSPARKVVMGMLNSAVL